MDADIKGFFNNVNHEWMIKFLELRTGEPNITKLINKFLKAGMIEEGIKEATKLGNSSRFVMQSFA
ncbi:hypothetical protein [Clostridium thailandense]|uniref:hypothetical protein n=1 Tax=Clostridium thailandense TaxID=2794346 RepID=UPI0039897B69